MNFVNLTKLTVAMMIFSLSVVAQAKPSTDDFNSMIEENTATQKVLTQQLQQQLKTQKINQNEKPDFTKVGEEVLGRGTTENVAVSNSKNKKVAAHKSADLDKKNFKRVSQELRDIKE